ncbi:MAG TPA: phage tail tube protein [Gemmatimonadaceae bacterium]|nr:phage tail tube protein [Gemmatimonadaceae bacterium]
MTVRNTMLALYLAKLEAVSGTDAAPVAAEDAIALAANVDPAYDYAFRHARDVLIRGGDINAFPPLTPKGKMYSWTKSAWWRGTTGAVTALTPIELDAWLQSAGYAAAYSGAAGEEQVMYTLISTLVKTMTEYFYHDGVVRKGVGALSEIGLSFDVGGPVIIECASQGIFEGVADAALPAGAVIQTTEPPTATDMTTFSVGGYAAGVIRSFKLQTGNSIQRHDGVLAPDGIAGYRLHTRKPTWTVVLEEPTRATKNFNALVDSQADVPISWLLGGTQYNTLGFDAASAKLDKVTPSNDNGLPLLTLTGGLYGDTPLSLTVK